VPATIDLLGALGFIWNLGMFKRAVAPVDGANGARAYEKYVYAAYVWLVISVLSVAVLSYYQAATGHPAPHALMGSYRHALTVGFISFMILGYAMRVLPIFLGRPIHSLRLLNGTFVLMMIGCTARVIFQGLTVPFGIWPFAVAGMSGWFEAGGLALFGYNLLRTLYAPEVEIAVEPVEDAQPEITPELTVARLVDAYPQAVDILQELGFAPITNPALRNTIGKRITLRQAAQIGKVPVEEVVAKLQKVHV
jgi:hypothetical protein